MGDVVNPLRVAVTGQGVGPGLYDCLFILGRDACLGADPADAGDDGCEHESPRSRQGTGSRLAADDVLGVLSTYIAKHT